MVLWFRCNEIIPGTSLGILFIAVILGIYFLQLELSGFPAKDRICRMASNYTENLEQFKEEKHKAFVVGYTGEVGKELLKQLASSNLYEKVVLIGRREVPPEKIHGVEFEQRVVDFEKLNEHADAFSDLDVGYCCLGTTKGKAGTDGFIKVDFDYVLSVGQTAKSTGCKHFSLVSSQGASKDSAMLYTRIKGQIEEALKNLQFNRLSVFRPGVIMCEREESRPAEAVARTLLKPIAFFFPTAITTPVGYVATAMINNALSKTDKTYELYENKAIHELAKMAEAPKGCKSKN
ncbi:oxidoreductase HTATIP2 [Patella vulgata]|uniref:oxidoreductase HTATIP2 n=1 Tax=Patella vulgata TaxID=6465 RepID=UPI00217FE171|nr:oxidoreductase HTATIP2 [Patella vulgata]